MTTGGLVYIIFLFQGISGKEHEKVQAPKDFVHGPLNQIAQSFHEVVLLGFLSNSDFR